MKSREKLIKKNKAIILLSIMIILIIATINIMEILIELEGYVKPDYDKIDISMILSKDTLTEEDYKTLFYQTGLGKTSIDKLLEEDNKTGKILKFQENFFADKKVSTESIGIVTSQESFVNEEGKNIYGFELAPYEEGYVIITKATYSLGWRHGHAGIITDAKEGTTLEAVILGENTRFQDINKWRVYPSFIMLKLKDADEETMNEIVNIAKNYMNDVPYGLTVGLTSKKNSDINNIQSTQCSHLVWYPFKQLGYDIDSDGSWLVTPKDIANSDLFEIVQIYGVDPNNIWP